jgi:outer membrane protein assembly factor BamB
MANRWRLTSAAEPLGRLELRSAEDRAAHDPAGPVLIDLDLLPPVQARTDPADPRRTAWRRIVALVTAVVAGTLLTADTAVADPPVTFAAAGTPVQVVGNTLYATEAEGARLTAYSLHTGRRRWTTAVPSFTQASIASVGGTLLLTSLEQARTVAVDPGTGRVRWQRTGTPVWWSRSGDRIALMSQVPAEGGSRFTVTMVTAASGTGPIRFGGGGSVGAVYSAQRPADGLIGLFVREDSAGGRLFDFATDRVRPLALPVGSAPGADPAVTPISPVTTGPQYEELVLAGDQVLRVSFWGSRRQLTGYAGEPLRPRWSVDGLGINGLTWWCGTALCTSDGGQSFAFDPVTGDVRWRASWGQLWSAGPGRAFAAWSVSRDGGRGVAVIDEASGREVLRWENWRPIVPPLGYRVPVLAETGDGLVVGVLDTVRLTARRLAELPTDGQCWANEMYVACRGEPERYRAWRY